MPNVPMTQCYEPEIGASPGGTSRQPAIDGVESVFNDWRHNNAVVAIELAKLRQRTAQFRPLHRGHNRVDEFNIAFL
jgi:hypothetical protein